MRWSLKAFGGFATLAVAMFAFANWKSSPLHLRICGPDTPYNLTWVMYGHKAIENWPAKLCGCTPPPGFRSECEVVRDRANRWWSEMPEGSRRHLESEGFPMWHPK